jgi:hypothetical protein
MVRAEEWGQMTASLSPNSYSKLRLDPAVFPSASFCFCVRSGQSNWLGMGFVVPTEQCHAEGVFFRVVDSLLS